MIERRTYDSLQACRAICAILVVLFHTSSTIFQNHKFWPNKIFNGIFNFGDSGVYFFFVLSGFIILAAHKDDIGQPDQLKGYMWRRAIRVYPVYWSVIIPITIIYTIFPEISKPELTDRSIVLNSFLLFGTDNLTSLAVAWTLFHEVLFYAFFSILIINRTVGKYCLSLWFFSCLLIYIYDINTSYHLSSVNLLFGFGMISYALFEKNLFFSPIYFAIFGIISFFSLGLLEVITGWSNSIFYGLCSIFVVTGLASAEALKPFNIPPMLKLLGDASYSIYLVHYPIISIITRIIRKIIPNMIEEMAFFTIVFIATISGVIFHLIFEKPLIAYCKTIPARFHFTK